MSTRAVSVENSLRRTCSGGVPPTARPRSVSGSLRHVLLAQGVSDQSVLSREETRESYPLHTARNHHNCPTLLTIFSTKQAPGIEK